MLRIAQFYKLSEKAIELHVAMQKWYVNVETDVELDVDHTFNSLKKLLTATGVNLSALLKTTNSEKLEQVYTKAMGRDYDEKETGLRRKQCFWFS